MNDLLPKHLYDEGHELIAVALLVVGLAAAVAGAILIGWWLWA